MYTSTELRSNIGKGCSDKSAGVRIAHFATGRKSRLAIKRRTEDHSLTTHEHGCKFFFMSCICCTEEQDLIFFHTIETRMCDMTHVTCEICK